MCDRKELKETQRITRNLLHAMTVYLYGGMMKQQDQIPLANYKHRTDPSKMILYRVNSQLEIVLDILYGQK